MAISLDSTSNGGSAFSFNMAHTCAGTILWVQTSIGISAVSANGVPMTLASSYHPTFGTFAGNCPYVNVWVLLNPPQGSYNITCTHNSGQQEFACAASYKRVLSYAHGNDSASVGGQTVTWESTVSLGVNDWGIAFFAGANNSGRTIDAYTGSVRRVEDGHSGSISILDSNSIQTPGSYSMWGQWSSGSGFITATTFSMQVIPEEITKSETITINANAIKTFGRSFSENMTIISSAISTSIVKSLNEVITIVPTFANIKGLIKYITVSDSISLVDSVVTSFVFFITGNETFSIRDAAISMSKRLRGVARGKNKDTNTKIGVRRT